MKIDESDYMVISFCTYVILERTVVGIMRRWEMISEPRLSHLLLLEHILEPKDSTRALLVV